MLVFIIPVERNVEVISFV